MFQMLKITGGTLAALGLAILAAGAAHADVTPPTIVLPGPSDTADESAFAQDPGIPLLTTDGAQAEAMIVRDAPILDPRDKGSQYTDGAYAAPRTELTTGEQAKLQMARAAVEASRANGTLPMRLPEELGPALTEEEITQIKNRQLVEQRPAEIVSDPAAGVGPDMPAVQIIGAEELNAIEQAKLDGTPLPAGPVNPAPAPETRKEVE